MPLPQVQNIDLATPLQSLIQSRRENQDRAAMTAENERQVARQAEADAMRRAEFGQSTQKNAMEIEQFRNNATTRQYIQDALTVKNLLDTGDQRNASMFMKSMAEKYKGTMYGSGLDEDYANIVSGNLEPVLSGINSELRVWQQMGQVAAPAGRQVQKVAPGETLVDESTGRPIYQAPPSQSAEAARPASTGIGKINQDFRSGVISQEERDQLINAEVAAQETAAATSQSKVTEQQTRDEMVKSEAARIMELTKNLIGNEEGLAGATGPFSSLMPSFKEKTVDFEANVKELQDLLTMANLGRMTGVLSESDIKLIANAASGLNMRASEGRMAIKLRDIQDRMAQRFPDIAASIFTEDAAQAEQPAQGEQPLTVGGFTIRQVN